jgi:hypothetical protein
MTNELLTRIKNSLDLERRKWEKSHARIYWPYYL